MTLCVCGQAQAEQIMHSATDDENGVVRLVIADRAIDYLRATQLVR
jgi:hypothetical protein